MSAPNDVLLIRKQDLKSFFEENKVRDNITSFTNTHNAFATNQYVFSNIARLVQIRVAIRRRDADRTLVGKCVSQASRKAAIVYTVPVP